jgi:exonuclease SbcC
MTANQLSGETQRLTALQEQRKREAEAWNRENTGPRPAAISDVALSELEEKVTRSRKSKAQLDDLDRRLNDRLAARSDDELEEKNKEIGQRIKVLDEQITSITAGLTEARKAHSGTQKEMQELLKGNSVTEARKKLKLREEKCRQDLQTVATEVHTREQKLAGIKSLLELLGKEKESLIQTLEKSGNALKTELAALEIDGISTAKAALLSATQAQELRKRFTELDRELHSKRDQLTKLKEEEAASAVILADLPDEATLRSQAESLSRQIRQLLEKMGGWTERITADDKAKKNAGDLTIALEKAKMERQRWAALNELIGSAKGDRFSRFAQSLTLDRLVAAANEQLVSLLEGRYRIDRKASEYRGKTPFHLGLEIIDTYQADNRRDTQTLSGGESFLVSLSLALGLSELAGGKTQIKSLFIDEGFGTLDETLLDTVIDTLENLQAQGKTIGLISHVKELRERIHHKIVVEKKGDGFSSLKVC